MWRFGAGRNVADLTARGRSRTRGCVADGPGADTVGGDDAHQPPACRPGQLGFRAMRRGGDAPGGVGLAAVALGLSGCELKSSGTDVVNGKTLFAQKCGACHTLARANTTGTAGPNLDEAFAQSRADGLGQSTFRGVVYRQILNPNIN